MRRPLVAGNWKMNKALPEARALARAVAQGLREAPGTAEKVEVVLGPPFLALAAVAEEVRGAPIGVAGQNCHPEAAGAFTGEVSAPMLKDAGATHVILGHSERRELLGESDAFIAQKAAAACAGGLTPILCLGEALPTREAGQALAHIDRQLNESFFAAFPEAPRAFVIAYEPIWAIGTGVNATPEQAQEVHAHIRMRLGETYGLDWAAETRILYGGSMNPKNAAGLLGQPDIDGGLIGGASLKAPDFLGVVHAAETAPEAGAEEHHDRT